eukprot:CAMPEP_0185699394 /NCGR_PEP_ID=MMETSP1164-20130828/6900_1 /TAXON_ID=1104430 /ORGANISM="Chrysoreinhardia sp, Strain CCMP2950" /LENGTH=55 /DNA_ID=CAMNT_0028366327 /DNA_START=77 /DNA_END=241 /DNA_ORIENTATION=+
MAPISPLPLMLGNAEPGVRVRLADAADEGLVQWAPDDPVADFPPRAVDVRVGGDG